ncbi:MAG: preprotein translocase subunit SecG [Clostridia bacterium]|nr:preprotein translocase subunit SecG [Clostridia bacterium]
MAWYHIVFGIALIVLSVLIVLFVLMQEGNQQGLGAISGGSSESFFGKNNGRTDEAKKAFLTKIFAGAFLVIVLVASIVMIFA